MFNRAAAIGLDIGSKKIKLVRVRKTQENWQIVKFGSMLTPAGLVEAGNIFDPEKLGREMITLVDQLGFKGQKVISAVSGQQVYIRTLVMPRMSLKETKEAAVYQAATFLPVPVEEAAIDIFPLRDFEDDEGKQREIFFVAVPRIQVENLETTCRMAGLKLVAVEIEPLALKRLLVPGNEGGVRAFLHLGASRSYFSVFEEEILLFYRSISSFYENIRFIIGEDPAGLEQINISQDGQFKFIIRDLIAEVGRLVEYYNIQSGKKIEGLYLCGGGASLQGLDEALNTQISCPVETADNLESFELSFDGDESVRRELNYDFPVALGLALREVI